MDEVLLITDGNSTQFYPWTESELKTTREEIMEKIKYCLDDDGFDNLTVAKLHMNEIILALKEAKRL